MFSTYILVRDGKANTEVPTFVYQTNDHTYVYKKMKRLSKKVTTIDKGDFILAKPVSTDWYYLTDEKGYVKAKNLERQIGEYQIVTSANGEPIYEEAYNKSKPLTTALEGYVVINYGSSKNGLSFVEYGDIFGYIDAAPLNVASSKPMNIENANGANLYLFASTKEKIIAKIPYQSEVKVLSQFADWTFVDSDYGYGYIVTLDITTQEELKKQEEMKKEAERLEAEKIAAEKKAVEKKAEEERKAKIEEEKKKEAQKLAEQQAEAEKKKAAEEAKKKEEQEKAAEKQQAEQQEQATENQQSQGSSGSGKKVALTFDDGPSANVTPQILNTLKKHQVKATFFVLGQGVEKHPNIAKQIADDGHQIAGHSWNHRDLSKLDIPTVEADLKKTNDMIQQVTGVVPAVYRPPYGAINNSMRNQIQLSPILWTVDTLDWKHHNPSQTLQSVKSGTKPGAIILMHDIHQATVTALEDVIQYLKSQGYTFVTIDEL